MNTHTPEPWRIEPNATSAMECTVLANRMDLVAETNNGHHSAKECIANARRIVACVNACAGISNEQLAAESRNITALYTERDAVRAQVASLTKSLHLIEADRNDKNDQIMGLREALQNIADGDTMARRNITWTHGDTVHNYQRIARAALERTKGE